MDEKLKCASLGALCGDALDKVRPSDVSDKPVCNDASVVVTDGDVLEAARFVKSESKEKVSVTMISAHFGWSKGKAKDVLERLYAADALDKNGQRYGVNAAKLEAFLEIKEGESEAAETAEPAEPADEAETTEAAQEAEPEAEKPSKSTRPKLKGFVKIVKSSGKPKRKGNLLDDLLKEATELPRKHCFEGEERQMKLDETFERFEELVEKFNQILEQLSGSCDIPFATTPARLERTEKGAKVTYRGEFIEGDWTGPITQGFCDSKVQKLEAWINSRANRAIAKAKRAIEKAKC